jgi:hypothetical protein
MSNDPRYSWLVMVGNDILQVNADECRYEPDGGLSFWHHREGRPSYLSKALAAGTWHTADIMSQLTGHSNEHTIIATRKTKAARWEQVSSE